MKRSRVVLTAALASALLVAVGDASAFCRMKTCQPKTAKCEIDENGCVVSGEPVRWRSLPLVYRFHARGTTQLVREEARAAVRAAFHRWSDVVCPEGGRTSLRFREDEDILEDKPLAPKVRGAEAFGIYFRDLGWPYEGEVDGTLAKANTHFGNRTGIVEYADIEVNTTKRFSVTEELDGIDLQAVMTHEVGHYIGLSHSRVPLSIMAESYCELDDRCERGKVAARRLSADDIDAVCALYPPGGVAAREDAEEQEATSGACDVAPSRGATDRGALAFASGLAVAAGLVAGRRRSQKQNAA